MAGSERIDVDALLNRLRQDTGSQPTVEGQEVRVSVAGKSGMNLPSTPEGLSLLIEEVGSPSGSFAISAGERLPKRLTIKAGEPLTTLRFDGRSNYRRLVFDLTRLRPGAAAVTLHGSLGDTGRLAITGGGISSAVSLRSSRPRVPKRRPPVTFGFAEAGVWVSETSPPVGPSSHPRWLGRLKDLPTNELGPLCGH